MASTKKVVGITCGVLLLLGILGIVGIFGLAKWGLGVVEDQVKQQVATNPALIEKVGTIESLDIDLTKMRESGDSETLIFRVDGTLADGWLTASGIAGEDDNVTIERATLELDSGEKVVIIGDE